MPSNQTTTTERSERDWFNTFLKLLYAVSLGIYIYFLFDGLGYYTTPFLERPYSEDYRTLRPAGTRGHTFGVVGAVMMLLMLLYSLRKRTRIFGKFGQLSRWLDIHIYLGIMGPLFIILHTTLRLNGVISVAFWSMIAVASSGILGRYLYLKIPRRSSGEELNLREIEATSTAFANELQQQLTGFEGMAVPAELTQLSRNHTRGIMRMIVSDMLSPLHKRKLKRHYQRRYRLKGAFLEQAVLMTLEKQRYEQRLQMLNRVQQLFHYWHVFHKPFALLMFLIMFVHIGVAIWLGYSWIL
ncbi:MAG: hypothetical protein ACRBF0_24350 [Calditrichia bacterium]